MALLFYSQLQMPLPSAIPETGVRIHVKNSWLAIDQTVPQNLIGAIGSDYRCGKQGIQTLDITGYLCHTIPFSPYLKTCHRKEHSTWH